MKIVIFITFSCHPRVGGDPESKKIVFAPALFTPEEFKVMTYIETMLRNSEELRKIFSYTYQKNNRSVAAGF